MNSQITNTEDFFHLKPLKAAKISEISEATAASPVPKDEKVNFHIGNPIQDEELNNLYYNLALFKNDSLTKIEPDTESRNEKELAELAYKTICNCVPYMPRGGYNSKSPNDLILFFRDWLNTNQQEPLEYQIGIDSNIREVNIMSGGIYEALRIIFLALSKYMVHLPASICYKSISIPEHLKEFENLTFNDLQTVNILEYLDKSFSEKPEQPVFLLLGKIPTETTRRKLRNICSNSPLYIIEINDAPNHLSLAREAKMKNRVLRILTPGVLSSFLKNSSITFAAGSVDFIKLLDTIHFQIKGTPASAEVDLLTYILKNDLHKSQKKGYSFKNDEQDSSNVIDQLIAKSSNKLSELVNEKLESFENKLARVSAKFESESTSRIISSKFPYLSEFSGLESIELLKKFIDEFGSNEIHSEIENSFLSEFINHNPEYDQNDVVVVSGSARTALSIIGFHCGIYEVLSPDYSWTYEHCFPSVKILPFAEGLKLDADLMIRWMEKKIKNDPDWKNYGALILNNPHNASGQVFDEESLVKLLKWTLSHDIYVIDDLSYKNIAPSSKLHVAPTIKQLAISLKEKGYIYSYQLDKLITVQSLSKTDCFAGARICIADIPEEKVRDKFIEFVSYFAPNSMGLLLAYMFYRNNNEFVDKFWTIRNQKFLGRMNALEEALLNLPKNRNQFDIQITRPTGSMYPSMIINKLPDGLSLEWISSGLAKEGIGLVPLTTFARTAKGFDLARKNFRLTLGGTDKPEAIKRKARRVLIDLNYMLSEENALYNKKKPAYKKATDTTIHSLKNPLKSWEPIKTDIYTQCKYQLGNEFSNIIKNYSDQSVVDKFFDEHLSFRLDNIKQRIEESYELGQAILTKVEKGGTSFLEESLSKELYKDNLRARKERFKNRLYDRTVHPTQIYSLKVETDIERFARNILFSENYSPKQTKNLSQNIIHEFIGDNVSIKSVEEADELLNDLNSLSNSETYLSLLTESSLSTFLSFWGDWDGSTRPSGQGHRLVAAAVVENVTQLCKLVNLLRSIDKSVIIDNSLLNEIDNLKQSNNNFWTLLNNITNLTNQLEKRFKTLLPYSLTPGRLRKIGIKIGVANDPLTSMFEHNDRLERKMFELRNERSNKLEYYFNLNKRLRKTLSGLIPEIIANKHNTELVVEAGFYKNLLNRFVLTPRIHQKTITARDQFTIDTTVHNIMEINDIADKYGNPGMILGLQISMSTTADALVSTDRKFRAKAEEMARESSKQLDPNIWIIPLFEEIEHVKNINNYLDKVWDYATHSRSVQQSIKERFTDIICELFIAGSDLSQQVGQTASSELYKRAKHGIIKWLAEHDLVNDVRMKLGSGEPMQRQGGYYSPYSGEKAFILSKDNSVILNKYLKESTSKSTEYATSPLMGVESGGDLRTFQSNISERMKLLNIKERSELLLQIKHLQQLHKRDLIRSTEPLTDTRLKFQAKGLQDLERITVGKKDDNFERFVELTKENFEEILYGTEEDMVGIHVISYFISRTTPTLRDRPTVRPTRNGNTNQGQKILEKISGTIPLKKHGTLLRAIGHNRAQTVVLGYNQLTTGLFRAMKIFCDTYTGPGDSYQILSDRILPHLPVYEILESLRLYHDPEIKYLKKLNRAFPPGNSGLIKMREDIDSFDPFVGLVQQELLRRHGINVSEFFDHYKFNNSLLSTLRPDLAVLLQSDLLNTNLDEIGLNNTDAQWSGEVQRLLQKPLDIRYWRSQVWEMLMPPIYDQVQAFNNLAVALSGLSKDTNFADFKISASDGSYSDLLKGNLDDTMRQFLNAAVQYLSNLPQNVVEVPIDIVRALKDIEQILLIEKQALSKTDQDKLNFYLLQMARITGENG